MDIVKLFGTNDLYEILKIERNATIQESMKIREGTYCQIFTKLIFSVKSSYYKLAKKYHPDRVTTEDKSVTNEKFNVIHQAYAILTNSEKKQCYDNGKVDVVFSKKTKSAHWERHIKVVPDDAFEQAANEYKNSAKEKEDISQEIVKGNGSMTHLMNHIPFMRTEDQPRIMEIIKELMKTNKIPSDIKIKKIKI